jgi:hypothetical protein
MSILPSISPVGLFGLGALSPVASTFSTTATSLSALGGGSTVVQLSSLGQFLSAVAAFQGGLSVLQAGSSDSGIGQNFGTDFGSLVAETQFFVDTVNGLQRTLNELTIVGGTFAAPSAFTQLTADLAERFAAVFDNGDSALTTLSDLGIEFQPAALPGFAGSLGIDLAKLKSAFDADPEGSFSLLALAVDSFEELAADIIAPSTGASSILSAQLQIATAQLSLNLFGDDEGMARSTLRGMTDLLTLASLGQGQSDTQAHLLIAMNEFSLVSSLLG